MKYDLHIHTTLSDGKEEKIILLKRANELSFSFMSFTDHNIIDQMSIADINAIYEALYQEQQRVNLIEGIEFDVFDYAKMHILGYGIKDKSLVIKKLEDLAIKNDAICQEILTNIGNHYNLHYTKEEILTGMNVPLLSKRVIIDWMVKQGHARDFIESGNLFTNKKAPTYERKASLYSTEVLDLIVQSGGIPVLAHPSTLRMSNHDLERTLIELKSQGLQGVETLNTSKTTPEQYSLYRFLADKHGLMTTSGTDFHNYDRYPDGIGVENDISDDFLSKMGAKR